MVIRSGDQTPDLDFCDVLVGFCLATGSKVTRTRLSHMESASSGESRPGRFYRWVRRASSGNSSRPSFRREDLISQLAWTISLCSTSEALKWKQQHKLSRLNEMGICLTSYGDAISVSISIVSVMIHIKNAAFLVPQYQPRFCPASV